MSTKTELQLARLVIPVKQVEFGTGGYRWPKGAVLAGVRNEDQLPLNQLKADLQCYGRVRARVVQNAIGEAALRIHHDKTVAHPEGYRLSISPEGVRIHARSNAGAYYGVQTLRELPAIYGRTLPACEITDEPDFERRGVYHDCSRGKVPTLQTLKDLVERLAHWKINELQLYVENVFRFQRHRQIGKGFSPFSPQEILALQDHCRRHHVRLVGSLASFGHMEKILSLPGYRHLGEMPGFHGLPAGTTLCPEDPGSVELLSELYEEFVPLFEAEDFNVCCDETWELGKGRSKRRAERLGTGRVYLDFLLKIYRLCQKHGKRMNAWADIVLKYPELLDRLPADIVLLNWDYQADGANLARTGEIARAGLNHMVCPGTSSWLSHGTRLNNAVANVANFAAQGRQHHAQGLLNTDWGDQGHRNFLGVSLHGFAHGAAHAWHGRGVDDERFTDNFCFHLFGQRSNRLARSLRLLGQAYVNCGQPVHNRTLLYFGLMEPLAAADPSLPPSIDLMDRAGLRRTVRELSDAALWPRPDAALGEFEKLALREMKLAAQMDGLACRRGLAGQALRAGERVEPAEWRRLGADMARLAKDFEELWLSRNKPSRLRDNLWYFQRAQRESERLAKGTN